MERALLDLLASANKRDEDRDGVAQGEAHDADTREGVEGNGGSKVDQSENKLDGHAEHHSVKGHVELRVDNLPPLEAGNGTIAGKGPRSARRSSRASNTTDQSEDEKRNEQGNGRTGASDG
jgi:hypothetical protein